MSERPLEVGDEVVLRGSSDGPVLRTVTRTTVTLVIVPTWHANSARFNRQTGWETGAHDSWGPHYRIDLATDDDRRAITKRRAERTLLRRRAEVRDLVAEALKTCSMERVEQIAALAAPDSETDSKGVDHEQRSEE